MSLLSSVAKVLGTGIPGQIYNATHGGSIFDTTPGYSATNVIRTQLGKINSGNAATGIAPKGVGSSSTASGPVKSTSSGGGGGGAAAPNPNQGSINLISSALGRLGSQGDTAVQNVQGQYVQKVNELNSGEQAAQGQYNTGTTQNKQQFVTNKNQINDQSSQGLQSLLRVLGAHGAGGSAAAQYAVPNAVGQVASVQRAGAGQNYGENQQTLDTSLNNYETGVGNQRKQLSDWLDKQVNSARSTTEQSRQSLLQQLAGLQTSAAAAQPFIDQINASANQVDQLAKFNPTYTGVTPVYTAPDVNSYTVQQAGAPVLGGDNSGSGAGTPITSFLLSGKDKQTGQPGLQAAPAF